jgi:VIT1/CCC1 family predicted Fe2+/Mn2+ transporter
MAGTFEMHRGEHHRVGRGGWLRAAVLGANDGLISTSSLLVGVAAAGADAETLLLTGAAAVVAGALSMAAGEYVSVSSQADTERADIEMERRALADHADAELDELTAIYVDRGLDPELARRVAEQLSARDPLAAHLRDELHLSDAHAPRPFQAAWASAAAFAIGAAPPVVLACLLPGPTLPWAMTVLALALLGVLGATASALGGAPIGRGALRVMVWGALAMAATAAIGRLFGTTVV